MDHLQSDERIADVRTVFRRCKMKLPQKKVKGHIIHEYVAINKHINKMFTLSSEWENYIIYS